MESILNTESRQKAQTCNKEKCDTKETTEMTHFQYESITLFYLTRTHAVTALGLCMNDHKTVWFVGYKWILVSRWAHKGRIWEQRDSTVNANKPYKTHFHPAAAYIPIHAEKSMNLIFILGVRWSIISVMINLASVCTLSNHNAVSTKVLGIN